MEEIDENARRGGTLNSLALYTPKVRGANDKYLGQAIQLYLLLKGTRLSIERCHHPDYSSTFFRFDVGESNFYLDVYDKAEDGDTMILSIFDKKDKQSCYAGDYRFIRKSVLKHLGI